MDPRLRGDDTETTHRPFVIPAQAGIQLSHRLRYKSLFHEKDDTTATMNQRKTYFVYILANKPNGTLYTGMTSNLTARIWQHKNNVVEGFSEKYSVHRLVYFEEHLSPSDAILREKQIKKWNREWKIRLIEEKNPNWKDLWEDISSF
jgi:putative endonuclease